MAKAIDKGYLTLNPIKVEIPSAALFFFLPETLLLLWKSGEMVNYNVSSEKNASTEVRRKVHFFFWKFFFFCDALELISQCDYSGTPQIDISARKRETPS